jgi:serine/threonine protein kinase
VVKQLGDGTYGNVWKAINRQTNEVVSSASQRALISRQQAAAGTAHRRDFRNTNNAYPAAKAGLVLCIIIDNIGNSRSLACCTHGCQKEGNSTYCCPNAQGYQQLFVRAGHL